LHLTFPVIWPVECRPSLPEDFSRSRARSRVGCRNGRESGDYNYDYDHDDEDEDTDVGDARAFLGAGLSVSGGGAGLRRDDFLLAGQIGKQIGERVGQRKGAEKIFDGIYFDDATLSRNNSVA
jgi:hypothetical protein